MAVRDWFSSIRRPDGRAWETFAAATRSLSAPPPLSEAVAATAGRSLSRAEAEAVRVIEDLRKELSASTAAVRVTDYGAGSPRERRSAEQMRAGVPTDRVLGEICRSASKPPVWALLLFQIVRKTGPLRCVEMGTCLGISSAYIASALELNGAGGRLVTLEGSDVLAGHARETFRRLGLDVEVRTGPFHETLLPTLAERRPVDFIFVDGHHDGVATKRYFDDIRPFLSPRAVMVFDDIRWSDGMRDAWTYISAAVPSYDFGSMGVCIQDG